MNKLVALALIVLSCISPVADTWDNPGRDMLPGEVYVDSLGVGDRADYYRMIPEISGYYSLSLRDLPDNTEWALLVFDAQDEYPPPYSPGPTAGLCRIAAPGTQDKEVICHLLEGKEYLIKVDGPTGEGYYTTEVEKL